MNESYLIFDGLALAAEAGKLPTRWRLLAVGENRYTKNGKEEVLTFSAEQLASIAAYQQGKGEKIPIDSRHALFLAAEAHKVTESEVRELIPHGTAALGFAGLEADASGLYVAGVEWLPLAAELVKDGLFRYYSPVIRGLSGESPLRITSVALDNVPALNNLDVIAASGEDLNQKTNKEMKRMTTKTEAALRKLLGDTALALSAETDDAVAAKIEALGAELPTLREKAAKTDELVLAAEKAERTAIITQALADGKLDNAQKAWAETVDIKVLSDLVAATPANSRVSLHGAGNPPSERTKGDELTPEEKKMADTMGLSAEEMKKAKGC